MADKKRSPKEIIEDHAKAIADAHAAGDKKRVEALVDGLPQHGAWHRRGQ